MGTYFYVPVSEAEVPKSGECIVDHWWTVHPERGLLFWTWRDKMPPLGVSLDDVKPQCNAREEVCRFLVGRLWRDGSHQAQYVRAVYLASARPRMRAALEEKQR